MIFSKLAIQLSESGWMPDFLIRYGIRQLSKQRLIEISAGNTEIASEFRARFFQSMRQAQIAPLPEMANAQHYEVPAAFFDLVLGKHRKYSRRTCRLDSEKRRYRWSCWSHSNRNFSCYGFHVR